MSPKLKPLQRPFMAACSGGHVEVARFLLPVLLKCKGPSTQIVGIQGPKTIQSMEFGT